MRRFACYPLLVALAMTTSLSAGLAAEACSEQPTPINVLKEITEFQGGQSLPIISSNRIAPAEATIDVIVQKPFESSPPQGNPPLYYRAIVQSDQSAAPQADAVALLIGTSVTAKAISKEDRLVKDGVVPTNSTVVTLDIPSSVGTAWQMGYIYVFGCRSPTDSPAFVSKFPIRISDRTYSQIAIWP